MKCEEVAVQFIAAYSRQLDLLTVWAVPIFGVVVATLYAIRYGVAGLPNLPFPQARYQISTVTLGFAGIFLFVSLLSCYLATNSFTQAIPEICAHDFSPGSGPLTSKFYEVSLGLMRVQYVAFVVGLILIFLSFLFGKPSRAASGATTLSQEHGREVE